MPVNIYESLQWTIAAGCPSPKCITEEVKQIFQETLGHIVEVQSCFITWTRVIW
jgi:hypothetical protein